MNIKAIIASLMVLTASPASAEITVTQDLQDDLASFDMTADSLASWMKDVLKDRELACSEIYSMGGKVPRTNTDTRRNVSISISCAERTYFVTVGIKTGWKVR